MKRIEREKVIRNAYRSIILALTACCIFLGVVLIAAANALAFIFRFGIFANIAWILYGLLFLINPVYPKRYHGEREKAKLAARIAGALCILVGFLTRFIV